MALESNLVLLQSYIVCFSSALIILWCWQSCGAASLCASYSHAGGVEADMYALLPAQVPSTSWGSGTADRLRESDSEEESAAEASTSSDACSDDEPDGSELSDSPPSEAAAGQRLGSKPRTTTLTLQTRLPCARQKLCPSYNAATVNPRSSRIAAGRALKQGLFCSGCQHAYCPGCLLWHDCATAARQPGRVTLQELQALLVSCVPLELVSHLMLLGIRRLGSHVVLPLLRYAFDEVVLYCPPGGEGSGAVQVSLYT
jgi:hypothetical protein